MSQELLINLPLKIETERLFLVPLEPRHDDIFYDAFAETLENFRYYRPDWSKYDSVPNQNEIKIYIRKKQIEWYQRSFLSMAALDKNTGDFIGNGEIHSLDWSVPKGRIGFWVRKNMHGRGYATEIATALTNYAFDILKLQRLEARAEKRNAASCKVIEKLGYKFLALFEKNKCGRNGELWDLNIYVRHTVNDLPDTYIKWIY